MIKNKGSVDRIVRLFVGAVLIGLFATGLTLGVWGIVSLVLAGVIMLTGLVNTCPLYLPFDIRTNSPKQLAN